MLHVSDVCGGTSEENASVGQLFLILKVTLTYFLFIVAVNNSNYAALNA
jgi:hypothetical protein